MGEETLSTAQLRALALVPKFTSAISIPCSLFIIKEVVHDQRTKKNARGRVSQRALLGMSIVDCLASFGWFLSTWAVPRDEPSEEYNTGTKGSCAFQGFLLQLAIGAPFYNACLALSYLLTIRYGQTDEQLRVIEPWLHGAVITFAVGTSIACIPLGLYNPIRSVCWIMGAPQGCGNSNYQGSDTECIRGDHAWIYGISLFYGPLWCCIIFTTIAMVAIYNKVRTVERHSERWAEPSVSSRTPTRRQTFFRGESVAGTSSRMQRRRHTFLRSEDVALQALLYTAAFYVTWLPSTIWSITHWFDHPMFWLDLLQRITEPSQGLLNFIVFLRPRKEVQGRLKRQLRTIFCCCRESPSDLPSEEDDSTQRGSNPGWSGRGSPTLTSAADGSALECFEEQAKHEDEIEIPRFNLRQSQKEVEQAKHEDEIEIPRLNGSECSREVMNMNENGRANSDHKRAKFADDIDNG